MLQLVDIRKEEGASVCITEPVGTVHNEEDLVTSIGTQDGRNACFDKLTEGVGEIAEIVLQGAAQLFLVGGVRLKRAADFAEYLANKGNACLGSDAHPSLLGKVLGLHARFDSLSEPILQSLKVGGIDRDSIVLQLARQPTGKMQENILVTQVVDVEFLGRVTKHDVIAVAVMEVIPNTPQFGALAAASVSAEQVAPSVGGYAHQNSLGNAQGSVKRAVAVIASRRLGIHPTGIVVTVERFVKL
ncbi:MAG: hypothetical protein OXN97_14130 [Bryobacterales bacterium]|nr:hypothetical protein [Bryobacterales bacterium]